MNLDERSEVSNWFSIGFHVGERIVRGVRWQNKKSVLDKVKQTYSEVESDLRPLMLYISEEACLLVRFQFIGERCGLH